MKLLARLLLTAWPSLSRDGLPLPSDAVGGLCCTLHAVSHFFIFWRQYDPQSQQIWAWNITVPVKGDETHLTLSSLSHFLTSSWKQCLQSLRVAAFWLYLLSILVNNEVLKRLELVLGRSSSWSFPDGKFGWSARISTFGNVTLLSHYGTVCAKRVLADKAVQVPPSAFSESKLSPALKLILWSRREALWSVCKWEAHRVLQ